MASIASRGLTGMTDQLSLDDMIFPSDGPPPPPSDNPPPLVFTGTDGNDVITGSAGDDFLIGLDGNDILIGGAGADTLDGDNGDDLGVRGNDTASYVTATAGVFASLANPSGNTGDAAGDTYINIENLTGSNFDDRLEGLGNNNVLDGGAGNDILVGGAGADTLIGGSGIDTASYATATAGLTASLANPSSNTGDAAGDTYNGVENLTGTTFTDTLSGDAGNNVLDGGTGNDILIGNDGNDTLIGGVGADTLIGGVGSDTASYAASTAAVNVNLATGIGSGGDAAGDSYSSIENLTGSGFADTLTGDANVNVLVGGAGNDVLNGGAGADTLIGGTGNDTYIVDNPLDVIVENANEGVDIVIVNTGSYTLSANVENAQAGLTIDTTITGNASDNILTGGIGNDTLIGGAGADTLIGGAGNDTASYETATAGVKAGLSAPGAPSINTGDALGDTYSGIENLTGSNFGDFLLGNDGDNILNGGAGNDTLSGTNGNDILIGGAGSDQLFGGTGHTTASYITATAGVTASLVRADVSLNTGDAFGDTYSNVQNLTGSNFDDKLTGDIDNSIIIGNAGNDRLDGGLAGAGFTGNDTLTGGAGNDTFIFHSGLGQANHDIVTDFAPGQDVMELHDGLFASATAALAAAAQSGNDVLITVDASTSILLQNVALANLHVTDFHLV